MCNVLYKNMRYINEYMLYVDRYLQHQQNKLTNECNKIYIDFATEWKFLYIDYFCMDSKSHRLKKVKRLKVKIPLIKVGEKIGKIIFLFLIFTLMYYM